MVRRGSTVRVRQAALRFRLVSRCFPLSLLAAAADFGAHVGVQRGMTSTSIGKYCGPRRGVNGLWAAPRPSATRKDGAGGPAVTGGAPPGRKHRTRPYTARRRSSLLSFRAVSGDTPKHWPKRLGHVPDQFPTAGSAMNSRTSRAQREAPAFLARVRTFEPPT
jgi:hypothetical protein